jgi:hypothetical protein
MKDNTAVVLVIVSWLVFVAFLMVKFSPWFILLLMLTEVNVKTFKGNKK